METVKTHSPEVRWQPTETRPAPAQPGHPRQNGRWAGYAHLLLARMRELQREPEVIFWVFIFPLLLALGLGIAFRNKPADVAPVAIVSSPGAQHALNLLQASPQHAAIHAEVLDDALALKGFRLGKYALVIEPKADGSFQYRYDPARPESVLALDQIDDALQAAAGRRNPLATTARISSEPGARYIDFLIPGLLGMNVMNAAMWGIGFALVEMRQRKLLKSGVAAGFRRARVPHEGAGLAGHDSASGDRGRALVCRSGSADRLPGGKNRERQRVDQPGDAAHVGFFRRLLLL